LRLETLEAAYLRALRDGAVEDVPVDFLEVFLHAI
jgi:hypothetical protein